MVPKCKDTLVMRKNIRGWAKLREEKILKNIQKIYF